jgi:hypothetical protein
MHTYTWDASVRRPDFPAPNSGRLINVEVEGKKQNKRPLKMFNLCGHMKNSLTTMRAYYVQ